MDFLSRWFRYLVFGARNNIVFAVFPSSYLNTQHCIAHKFAYKKKHLTATVKRLIRKSSRNNNELGNHQFKFLFKIN